MKRSKIVFACVCACIVFAVLGGCKNAISGSKPVVNGNGGGGIPPTPGKPEATPQTLLEFMFEEAKVDGLRGDIYGTIDEATKTVSVKVPMKVVTNAGVRVYGIDRTKLKATFKVIDEAKVFVGSTEQQSGVTENNFSDSVIYTVKAKDGTEQKYTIKVEEATEQLFSDFSAADQAEIASLYSYYWADDGNKGECPALDAARLAVYANNAYMSMGFSNLRWSKVSPSMWICFSYASSDTNYNNKRIVFTFTKDRDGTVKLWDTIILMGGTYGPYLKGKKPDTFEESGVTYYTYDKNTYDTDPRKSPKLFEPRLK